MENTPGVFSTDGSSVLAFSQEAERLSRSKLLVVEDDRDIRDMLVTLLELSGFVVVACDTAEQGLEALRDDAFDLVLTDYALPRESGLWLLEQAAAEGLIDDTPAIVVTAQPDVLEAEAYEIVHKPFDLDDLVGRVRQRLAGKRAQPSTRSARPQSGGRSGNGEPECPEPVELILYVSNHSPRSAAAIRNIQNVLARLGASRVKLTICDLSAAVGKGPDDGVALTATIGRKTPGPRTFILGHITNPDLLLEMLGDCALEPRAGGA